MNKILLPLIIICISTFSWSNNQLSDTLSYLEKRQSGQYWPYYKIQDTVLAHLPVKAKIDVNIDDLRDLSLDNNFFYVKINSYIYPTAPLPLFLRMIDAENTQQIDDSWYTITYPQSDKVNTWRQQWIIDQQDIQYDKRFYNQFEDYFEGTMPFKWDLRDYPFDIQKLQIEYTTAADTSFMQILDEGSLEINTENFKYLLDGYKVHSGKMEIKEKKGKIYEYADGKRQEVKQDLIITLNLSREGSFLYFKLFFGAILSFLISVLAFFMEKKEFESRITLCVASVFGAIGNKYFVESSMPEIQILTKADMINNLMIFLVIVNICLIIAQQSSKIKLGFLENNFNATIFSIILFIITNLMIVYF